MNIKNIFAEVENRGPNWVSLMDFGRIARKSNFSPARMKKVCNAIDCKNERVSFNRIITNK